MIGDHQQFIMISTLCGAFGLLLYALGMLAGKVKTPPKKIRRVFAVSFFLLPALYALVLAPPADRTGAWLAVAIAISVLGALAAVILLFIPGKNEPEESLWASLRGRSESVYGHTGAVIVFVAELSALGVIFLAVTLRQLPIHHIDTHLFDTLIIVAGFIMMALPIVVRLYRFYKFVPRNRR